MEIIWSKKYSLSQYSNAPNMSGIYMVGLNEPGLLHDGDEFLGKNLPDEFVPKYIGISKRSIRRRLYCHSSKRGNKHIRQYILDEGINNLEFIYCDSMPTEVEHQFLIHTIDLFNWNVKKSEYGALIKQLRAL